MNSHTEVLTREQVKNLVYIGKGETYPYNIVDNVDEIIDKVFDYFENKQNLNDQCKNDSNEILTTDFLSELFGTEVIEHEKRGACTINHPLRNVGKYQAIIFKDLYYSAEFPNGVKSTTFSVENLATMCKSWAFEKCFSISSCKRTDGFNRIFWEAWSQKFTYHVEGVSEHTYTDGLYYKEGECEEEAIFKCVLEIFKNIKNIE